MLKTRTLLTRHIHQSWKFITLSVKASTMAQENLEIIMYIGLDTIKCVDANKKV
jgi:hypothetical protein